MSTEIIKAHLNLYAVFQNLEDLVERDTEMKELARNWDISIQFTVIGGPRAFIVFKDGKCVAGRGNCTSPSVILLFTSSAHLNRMFDNKGNPIPVKGFTKLGFLTKEFPKLTARLEHYLKPTPELLKDRSYLEMNTLFTLNTAAFAARELALLDPVGRMISSHMGHGSLQFEILPDGPSVYLDFTEGAIDVRKGKAPKPMAMMGMNGITVANDFLNGRIDSFTAIASGDVVIRGQMPMLDGIGLILDRVPLYLS